MRSNFALKAVDGIERISTQALFDLLEVSQRGRTTGACRRMAKLMRELGWTPTKARGLEAERVNAPRANPNDPSTFTVILKAPADCSYVNLMSGRGVSVPTDRLVSMSPEDAKPLLGIGWTTQNNLEIEAHVPRLKFGLIA